MNWTTKKQQAFQQDFLNWYQQNQRDLPWRHFHDPYHIWLSEIMLQQTQVHTVIPYYQRFLKAFPTIADLAATDEATLFKAWEGLGYYSRARNLQRAAQQICTDYQGVWPQTAAELEKLAGIGPYTAAAIASIAFDAPEPAVDGNAYRVFARLLQIKADVAQPKTRGIFAAAIRPLLPAQGSGDFNQATMDLGATICTPKDPACLLCPVQQYCQAYQTGTQLDYPVKTKKPKPKPVHLAALVIGDPQQWLMQQRPGQGLLANLWTYPLVSAADLQSDENDKLPADWSALLTQYVAQTYQLDLNITPVKGRAVTHTFTHLKWTIDLYQAKLPAKTDLAFFPGQLVAAADYDQLAVPTVQKKLQQRFLKDSK